MFDSYLMTAIICLTAAIIIAIGLSISFIFMLRASTADTIDADDTNEDDFENKKPRINFKNYSNVQKIIIE